MKSILLMSVLLAQLLIPIWLARDPRPKRGLKRMMLLLAIFNVVYVFYISQLHPVLFVPVWTG